MNKNELIASLEGRIIGGEMHGGGYIHVPQDEAEAVLELLKAQEPLKPFRGNSGWSCSACGNLFRYPQEYCDVCGRQVKWDD